MALRSGVCAGSGQHFRRMECAYRILGGLHFPVHGGSGRPRAGYTRDSRVGRGECLARFRDSNRPGRAIPFWRPVARVSGKVRAGRRGDCRLLDPRRPSSSHTFDSSNANSRAAGGTKAGAQGGGRLVPVRRHSTQNYRARPWIRRFAPVPRANWRRAHRVDGGGHAWHARVLSAQTPAAGVPGDGDGVRTRLSARRT
jgi:hypothetical protein